MIKDYKIFENLQQAEKFVNNRPKGTSKHGGMEGRYLQTDEEWKNFLEIYSIIKNNLKSLGKLGYLYLFTRLLYLELYNRNGRDKKSILDNIMRCIDLIVNHNIKIDIDKYIKQIDNYHSSLIIDINNIKKDIDTNKFIDKWAPGFLKKELKDRKKDNFFNLRNVLFNPGRFDKKRFIDNIDIGLLRGKISMFETPKEWIKYVRGTESLISADNISKLKKSNDIKIYYEDDEWLIYQPFTYESMNIIKYPYWCTISEKIYNQHIIDGYFWVVILNKKIKNNSYIAEFKQIQDGYTFLMIDYNDIILTSDRNTGENNVHTLIDFKKKLDDSTIQKHPGYWTDTKLNDSEIKIFKIFLKLKNEFKNEIIK